MKILNINSYFFSSTVHERLQSEISCTEIENATYAPLAKGYKPRNECSNLSIGNLTVAHCYNNSDKIFFHLKQKKILKDFWPRYEFSDYDCLHAHSLFSNGYIAMKTHFKYNIPYIVTVRDTDLNIFFKYMPHLRSTGLKIISNAEKVVFLSNPYKEELIRKFVPSELKNATMEKSVVIPNGIDSFWLENKSRGKTMENKNKPGLLHVGLINKRKNTGAVIDTMEIMRKRGYEPFYTLVGEIEDYGEYKKLSRLKYTRYINPVPKEELLEIYRENDILVMPSFTETFGLVYAEAMSQGLPVIYTRDQGFDKRFADGEVGYGVDCNSPDEIAERVMDICDNYSDISKTAVEKCVAFDWKIITGDYVKLYMSVEGKKI